MKTNKEIKEQFEKIFCKIDIPEGEYLKVYKKIIEKGHAVENVLNILNFITVFLKTFSIFFISFPGSKKNRR